MIGAGVHIYIYIYIYIYTFFLNDVVGWVLFIHPGFIFWLK